MTKRYRIRYQHKYAPKGFSMWMKANAPFNRYYVEYIEAHQARMNSSDSPLNYLLSLPDTLMIEETEPTSFDMVVDSPIVYDFLMTDGNPALIHQLLIRQLMMRYPIPIVKQSFDLKHQHSDMEQPIKQDIEPVPLKPLSSKEETDPSSTKESTSTKAAERLDRLKSRVDKALNSGLAGEETGEDEIETHPHLMDFLDL